MATVRPRKAEGIDGTARALTVCVRTLLADVACVHERRLFGRDAFFVRGYLCVTAGGGRLMCRIDPSRHAEWVSEPGCAPMRMRGRIVRGYLDVDAAALPDRRRLERWIARALAFNATLPARSR
ncbi:MAG: TfoX/Sxy family protein [Xanthomonadales bacterium]|nr:TfoX/Sxy family protein [Xanthomonadales bacterium]